VAFVLTFDDGPGPSMPALLDVLAGADARATFFVLGRNVEQPVWGSATDARAMIVRAIRDGHEIANHSWSHVLPIDGATFMREVAHVDDLIRAVRRDAGVDRARRSACGCRLARSRPTSALPRFAPPVANPSVGPASSTATGRSATLAPCARK
jgi:peptidoglycan/xylan/chitin deacetylase (PgdA/CDA1 family)